MNINTENKKIQLLVSFIKGFELNILQILEKYKVCDMDINKIIDLIAKIETYTIVLYKEKHDFDEYNKKIEQANVKKPKPQRSKNIVIRKRIFKVYKNNKFLFEGGLSQVSEIYGIDKGFLSKINSEANAKGYHIEVVGGCNEKQVNRFK